MAGLPQIAEAQGPSVGFKGSFKENEVDRIGRSKRSSFKGSRPAMNNVKDRQ